MPLTPELQHFAGAIYMAIAEGADTSTGEVFVQTVENFYDQLSNPQPPASPAVDPAVV